MRNAVLWGFIQAPAPCPAGGGAVQARRLNGGLPAPLRSPMLDILEAN